MTRLAQTLMHIKNLIWIVVEDSNSKTDVISDLLKGKSVSSVHLFEARPKSYKNVKKFGRGVANRLKALNWIRQTYRNSGKKGVIYFADDDNAYDTRVFSEMRFTEKVSVFPVGLIGRWGVSAPILDNKTAKVIGFHDNYNHRKFSLDMAGFAVGLQYFIQKPKASMIFRAGSIEDYFLRSLDVELDDLEPKASNCTWVLVWHTRTQGNPPDMIFINKVDNYNNTNIPELYKNLNKTITYN